MTDRRRSPSRQGARRRDPAPTGRRLGPIPLTATTIVLGVAIVLSLAYLAFAVTVRDASQIPLLASGAVVLGLVFAAVAFTSLRALWRSSVDGRDGRALGHALVGGVAAIVAAGCLAAAYILGILARPV